MLRENSRSPGVEDSCIQKYWITIFTFFPKFFGVTIFQVLVSQLLKFSTYRSSDSSLILQSFRDACQDWNSENKKLYLPTARPRGRLSRRSMLQTNTWTPFLCFYLYRFSPFIIVWGGSKQLRQWLPSFLRFLNLKLFHLLFAFRSHWAELIGDHHCSPIYTHYSLYLPVHNSRTERSSLYLRSSFPWCMAYVIYTLTAHRCYFRIVP